MGCASGKQLQVVNEANRPLTHPSASANNHSSNPQIQRTNVLTNESDHSTRDAIQGSNTKAMKSSTKDNDSRSSADKNKHSITTNLRKITNVTKTSGTIETFTILWSELPQVPEMSLQQVCELQPSTPMECWNAVRATSIKYQEDIKPAFKRRGWKTIRLFVSSTFKDFHAEREVLVKQVFPELRLWCEKLKLHLIECDLRWGVPKEATSEETLRICLGEIDRCYEDNQWPFFLNLSSHRSGWIPEQSDVPQNLAQEYGWIFGTSITEMEIIHGAFRKANPNSLFLIRDPEFITSIPNNFKNDFTESSEEALQKMKLLKTCIKGRFPDSRVVSYSCSFNGIDEINGTIRVQGLGPESTFVKTVIEFFKRQISHQYPLDDSPMDKLEVIREAHEVFLNTRSSTVLGRDDILDQIQDYICSKGSGVPLVLVGVAGAGKSAVLARSAATTVNKARNHDIPNGSNKGWNVFYHFIGAAPGSTDLGFMLQRMLKELKYVGEIPADIESLVRLSNITLNNPNLPPTILFFDALNQLDKTKEAEQVTWLPFTLSKKVRIICSVINDTPCHRSLAKRIEPPKEVFCGPLDLNSRKEIADQILTKFNKRLDSKQMELLLSKEASANPLWLSIACEELRVFGLFSKVTEMIKGLADGLLELLEQVLTRFEAESGGHLMVATLCLLECSRHGLLERELLELLGEDEALEPPSSEQYLSGGLPTVTKISPEKHIEEKDVDETLAKDLSKQLHVTVEETYRKTDFSEKKNSSSDYVEESQSIPSKRQPLPAAKWAVVFRALKPFLRPCGDSGEGRLDFYHRAMSKAVRKKQSSKKPQNSYDYFSKYFKVSSEDYRKFLYTWWHGKLAGYFEQVEHYDRKAEELPYHLEKLLDHSRLARCLLEWPVFEKLAADEFNIELLRSWRKAGGYATAATLYTQALEFMSSSNANMEELADKKWKVARFLCCAGQYDIAEKLSNEAIDIETKRLGARTEKLANLYELLTDIKAEVSKLAEFIRASDAGKHYDIVQIGLKAISLRKNLQGDENKYHLGLVELRVSWHYGAFYKTGIRYKDLTLRKAKNASGTHANNALQIFQELGDIGHLAEAKLNVGMYTLDEGSDAQMKNYEKALELCILAYGEFHKLTTRIVFNTAIIIEYTDKGKSYTYYKRAYDISCEILGPTHPSTLRVKSVLDEPEFLAMAENP
ncbi:Telomerase protein component 1 [Trichoplax sp. H2]|nr:Telomerase protein component 1 [Trichoplax sp. H2]|eukprot:RDD44594.1 Telomerase protein component 1 [Trichoplax sp. H2]